MQGKKSLALYTFRVTVSQCSALFALRCGRMRCIIVIEFLKKSAVILQEDECDVL